ncbi:sphingomyelin phosphodiesterase [Tolypothrix sp. PCC 7601]|nr:sphingomyelin phosphodiesterase [Tolypothrix sp. PCC 7601]
MLLTLLCIFEKLGTNFISIQPLNTLLGEEKPPSAIQIIAQLPITNYQLPITHFHLS